MFSSKRPPPLFPPPFSPSDLPYVKIRASTQKKGYPLLFPPSFSSPISASPLPGILLEIKEVKISGRRGGAFPAPSLAPSPPLLAWMREGKGKRHQRVNHPAPSSPFLSRLKPFSSRARIKVVLNRDVEEEVRGECFFFSPSSPLFKCFSCTENFFKSTDAWRDGMTFTSFFFLPSFPPFPLLSAEQCCS